MDIQRKKDEEDYYAPDSQVAAALDQVAKHRTDIFGIEETGVGRKIGEERKVANEIGWDGHAKTADQASDKHFLLHLYCIRGVLYSKVFTLWRHLWPHS